MKTFVRFFIISLVILFLANIHPVIAHALTVKPIYPVVKGVSYEDLVTLSPYRDDPFYIDANIRKVDISFTELDDTIDYGLCSRTDQTKCVNDKEAEPAKAKEGTISATVCGDEKDKLKGALIGKKKECNDDKDYFHEGHVYRLGLFSDTKAEGYADLAEFYVKHSMPWVQIKIQRQNGPTPIDITLWGRRPGGDKKNNYQIIIEGKDNKIKTELCVGVNETANTTIPAGSQISNPPVNISGPKGEGASLKNIAPKNYQGFPPGKYVVKINERVNETGAGLQFRVNPLALNPLGLVLSQVAPGLQPGPDINVGLSSCSGGYTYMEIPITISPIKKDAKASSVGMIQFDPNESDAAKELDLFAGARAICADYKNGTCYSVNTALGKIETTPQGFIKTMFQFVLVLAGFGAIIIIIYSGYLLMISRGDKEKISAARQTITAAVVGLLFIIFSIVILEIIGVEILRIPGLTR